MTFRLISIALLVLAVTFAVTAQDFDALASAISSGSAEQKRNALFNLRNFKSEQASRIAVPALRDADEAVRATAAFSVIYLPPTEAMDALLPNLNDKMPSVRSETAYALGKVGDARAVRPLIEIYGNAKEVEVKNAAIVALGDIADESAVEFLTGLLTKKLKSDDEFARRSAARAIGVIALKLQTTSTSVATPESFLPEKYKSSDNFRDLAAESSQFRSAMTVLTKVLSNAKEDPDTRREAAFAIGAIASPDSSAILTQFSTDQDYYLAEICKEFLLKIKD